MFLFCVILFVVLEMKTINPQKKGSLRARVLRLLGTIRGFGEPSVNQEKIVHAGIPGNNYYNHQKEIETACLEAERKRAEAIMEWQKSRFIR
jgi:hypothetical protein